MDGGPALTEEAGDVRLSVSEAERDRGKKGDKKSSLAPRTGRGATGNAERNCRYLFPPFLHLCPRVSDLIDE